MLVPVIGLVQVGWQGRADRYTYLPQIGLYIASRWAVLTIDRLWHRYRRTTLRACCNTCHRRFELCALVQTSYWRDSETVIRHALAVTENNDVAENNLGIDLSGERQSWTSYPAACNQPWIFARQ
jgi:hypothetical protein